MKYLSILLVIAVAACGNQAEEEFLARSASLTLADPVEFEAIDIAIVEENYPRARQLIEQAVLARQSGPLLDFYLALYQLDTGALAQGMPAMEHALATAELSVKHRDYGHLAMARAHVQRGAYGAGLVALAELSQPASEELRAMLLRGVAYDGGGDHARALQEFTAATERYPGAYQAWNNMGFTLLLLNRPSDAIDPLSRALALRPHFDKARSNLRVALALIGDYDGALAGVGQEGLAAQLNNVGFAALTRGDLANAEAYFSRALTSHASFYEKARNNLNLVEARRKTP